MLFVDKYRPHVLGQFVLHRNIAEKLKTLASTCAFAHLLFHGPPGVGKRTLILAFLRELYGMEVEKVRAEHLSWKSSQSNRLGKNGNKLLTLSSPYHIEITPSEIGSNDRLIIQETLKDMGNNKSILDYGQNDTSFKVVLLNEADKMSKDAQQALRKNMETYSSTCRLILCCENTAKVLEPLRSRSVCIRVPSPHFDEIARILCAICKNEGIELRWSLAVSIAHASNRNLRKAILTLETCVSCQCPLSEKTLIPTTEWELYVREISQDILEEQSPFQLYKIRSKLYQLLVESVPPTLLLKKLFDMVSKKLDEQSKYEALKAAAFFDQRICRGSKAIFHLEAFVAKLMYIKRDAYARR